MFVLILGLNAHALYGMVGNVSDTDDEDKCMSTDTNYSVFLRLVWSWIDLCAFCLILSAIIIIGNSHFIFKIIVVEKLGLHILYPHKAALNGKASFRVP